MLKIAYIFAYCIPIRAELKVSHEFANLHFRIPKSWGTHSFIPLEFLKLIPSITSFKRNCRCVERMLKRNTLKVTQGLLYFTVYRITSNGCKPLHCD